MHLGNRLGALLAAASLSTAVALGSATSARADTTIPSFFKNDGWWLQQNPNADPIGPTGSGGSSDKWIYPDFPIACNVTPGSNNQYKVYWVKPDDVALNYNTGFTRRVIAAASSGIVASAGERLGPNGVSLKNSHSPKWKTIAPGPEGNCFPEVTQLSVPRSVLTWSGGGYWTPYKTGQLDSYVAGLGLLPDNVKAVFLLQEWGSPDGDDGMTTWSIDSQPGPENGNNDGGDGIYVDMHAYGWGAGDINEWASPAHALMHEMTHNLGAFVSGAPHNNSQLPGHATDCYEVTCEWLNSHGETGVTTCGYVAGHTLNDMWEARQYNRLDCNRDDYWSNNGAAWTQTRWNTFNSSFLWANPQPAAKATPAFRRPGPEVIAFN